MKKFYLFMLMAVGLLISGNSWAYSGTGTENDPYLVDNATDLKTLVKDYGGYIKLSDNIDDIGNASLSIAKAVTLNLNGKRLINQTLTSNSLISITASGKVVIKNGTLIKANGIKGSTGKLYDGSNPCLKINSASAEVSLEGLTIGSSDQTTGDNRHLHYGINLVVAKSLKISNDVQFNGAKSNGSDITIGNAAYTEVIIDEIYNESNATILINASSGATYESGYRPICIKKISKNNGEIYAKFQSKIDDIDENACAEGGKIFICENSFVPADKWEKWASKGYIDTQKYTFTIEGLVPADAGYYKVVDASNCVVEVIKGQTSQKYFAFDAAYNSIAAGETATVKILKSSLDLPDGYHLDVTENRNITLELNGKTIRTVGGQSGDYFIKIDGGTLSITGNGTINAHPSTNANSYESVIYLYGSSNKDAEDYSVLNVGEGVKFINTGDNVDLKCLIAIFGSQGSEYAYGVKVNFNGTADKFDDPSDPEPGCMGFMTINGTATAHETDKYPHITIGGTAKIYAEKVGIYAAGFGNWTIEDGATIVGGLSAIEIRAGEMNIAGGTLTCTGSTISCNPNGSGTTTCGAGIAVAQHVTKEPVIVNISGGVISGPFAIIQVNPQNNTETDYLNMKVNVTGGKFVTTNNTEGTLFSGIDNYGTVNYAANAMLLSQNRRILVSGGYYKDYDPAPFVMPGYVSVLLADLKTKGIATAEDEQAIAEGYIYKVTRITEAGSTDESKTSGDWHVNADDIWNEGEPDKLTQVKISGQEIIVSTPATAYGIEISGTQEGNTKLTITETGRLMVDLGGIDGTTPITFDIQNGGQMAIAPAATLETESQPEATVTLVADWAHRKVSADGKEQGDLVAEDLYWQHIATPLSDGNQPAPSQTGVSYVNTWNLVNGWTSATWANVVTPFVGYQISSIKPSDDKITLTYKGQLVGNHVDPMTFTRIGFSFFGNSYLAPIDIRELLTCLETKNVVDPTILLYDSQNGYYATINRASFYIPGMIAEIKPMQSFFVFSESATNVDFDYTKAVWNSFCAKAQSGVVVPTAPKMQENPFSAIACIDVQAESGAKDRVMLFEGDEMSDAEDKGYDAHKMMTSGVNIYAKGSYADLAILATNNLLNSQLVLKTDANTNYTMSFANIKGEYALYDALTGRTINMVEGATYDFEAQSNATITDRFYVVEAAKAPTTMENVDAQAGSCKFMKNGIMFIERNNKVYNAQGQIVK